MSGVKIMPNAEVEVPESRALSPAITPMQMMRIAIERGTDVAMLEKLMGLQERYEANEARKAFVHALAQFKAKPPSVVKNKKAGFDSRRTGERTEYEYATLDQVCDAIGGALSVHGLSHRWDVNQDATSGIIRVTCVLTHELGHSERVSLQASPDTSGSKNPIQAIGSAVSYLQRYSLLAATGLATKEQDDDGHGTEGKPRISDEQKDTIVNLLRETNADVAKFLAYFQILTLDDMFATDFDDAKAILLRKKAKGTPPASETSKTADAPPAEDHFPGDPKPGTKPAGTRKSLLD